MKNKLATFAKYLALAIVCLAGLALFLAFLLGSTYWGRFSQFFGPLHQAIKASESGCGDVEHFYKTYGANGHNYWLTSFATRLHVKSSLLEDRACLNAVLTAVRSTKLDSAIVFKNQDGQVVAEFTFQRTQ